MAKTAKKNISNYLAKFKKSGNIPKNLLYNVYVLYFFLLVSVIFLFGLTQSRDFTSVAIFILIGFITSFFSKNMVVIMAIAIIFTALLKTTKSSLEGFQEGETAMNNANGSTSDSAANSASSTSSGTDYTRTASSSMTSGASFPTPDEVRGAINTAKSNSDKKDQIDSLIQDTEKLKDLEKQATDLLNVQTQILDGLQKMEPMFDRAEALSSKLEGFGKR